MVSESADLGEEGAEVSLRSPAQVDLRQTQQGENSVLGKRQREEVTAHEVEIPPAQVEQHSLTLGEFDEAETVMNPATAKWMNSMILPLDK